MEPMTLGSPIQSPTHLNYGSPGSHGHGYQQPQSSFLPSFLMGDPTSPSSQRPMMSPTKLNFNRSMSLASSGTPQSPAPSQQRGPALLAQNASLRKTAEKHGGPPTMSLMGGLSTPTRNNSPSMAQSFGSPQTPHLNFPSTPKMPSMPVEEENLYSPSTWEPLDPLDVWVTVFGFPPSAASYVLSQFCGCGTVLQHSMPPNANWMHVKFQSRLMARKAIGKNGCVLGSSIMVGVSACTDSNVLENLNTSIASPTLHENSVASQSVANVNSSLGGTPRSIRPLTQAYKDAQGDYKVMPNANTPNKDTGLVSKVMGSMFGW